MRWSTRSFLVGVVLGAAAIALAGLAAWVTRAELRNAFSGVTGYTVEQGTLVTRARFDVMQDGVRVGVLEKGVLLDLRGNTDKMTRFTVELAWPETGPRKDYFAPVDDGRTAFLELGKVE